MDSSHFDALTRSISVCLTRRLLGRVTSLVVLSSLALLEGEHLVAVARKHRVRGESNIHGNKATMCFQDSTIRVPKKKRKKYLAKGATRGKCKANPICTPVCTGCGGPDGCGGTCPGCGANTICVNGACRNCTLICDDSPSACGEALQDALAEGGAIYLCPGVYEGTFVPQVDAQIHGAGGTSDDPETSTILVAPEGSRVMIIDAPIALLLAGVRVTGGEPAGDGGGIRVNDELAELSIQECVITDNSAAGPGGSGGGIANLAGTVIISDSEISSNFAGFDGGGIYNAGTVTVTSSTIIKNAAGESGGGIFNSAGTTSLDPTVSISENDAIAVWGGAIYRAGGTVNLNGASVTLNQPAIPDQCSGSVPGCP